MIDPARIAALDDPTALSLLSAVARPRLRAGKLETSADPAMETPLAALFDGPQPERFDAAETVALVVGALVVLQIHVRFERTAAGKWKVLLDKPTTSDSLLKPLVQKLLALLPGAGRG